MSKNQRLEISIYVVALAILAMPSIVGGFALGMYLINPDEVRAINPFGLALIFIVLFCIELSLINSLNRKIAKNRNSVL